LELCNSCGEKSGLDGPATDGEIDWNVKPVRKQSFAFSLGTVAAKPLTVTKPAARLLGAIGRTGARKMTS